MPNILFRLLKMSLLLRLFVFIAPWGFTFYCLLFRFIILNIWVTYWYAIGNTIFCQKCLNIYCYFINAASKVAHIAFSCEQFVKIDSKQLKYTIQKLLYSAKQPKQCLKVHSDYLNIQKSFQKQPQALGIYSTSLLFSVLQLRYRSFFNPNPTQ